MEFAQLLTKSIANQSNDNFNDTKSISEQFDILVKTDNDISYIEFKNQDNEVIYSARNNSELNEIKTS